MLTLRKAPYKALTMLLQGFLKAPHKLLAKLLTKLLTRLYKAPYKALTMLELDVSALQGAL